MWWRESVALQLGGDKGVEADCGRCIKASHCPQCCGYSSEALVNDVEALVDKVEPLVHVGFACDVGPSTWWEVVDHGVGHLFS